MLSANHHDLAIFESAPEVRALSSAGITRFRRSYDPVRFPPWPPPIATLRPLPSPVTGLPRLPEPPFRRAVPTTPADRVGTRVDCFPTHAAFPKWQEGRHPHCHFRGLLRLTHVTARRIAQPPKAAFVTRLQPCRLPDRAARQLPDQSTTLWVESSSTSDPRLRGALSIVDIATAECRRFKMTKDVAHTSDLAHAFPGVGFFIRCGYAFERLFICFLGSFLLCLVFRFWRVLLLPFPFCDGLGRSGHCK
jgi:hypothetical protein